MALVSLTATAAEDEKGKVINQEMEKLQGKWKQVSVEINGKEFPVPTNKGVIVTIDGDRWRVDGPDGKSESTFSIDPTQNPKAIDRIFKSKGEKDNDTVRKCIYKLDKDTLSICRTKPSDTKERPKEFKTADGEAIFVYKRMEK
jgi:uncharacterized protein (TIGR03067 family)